MVKTCTAAFMLFVLAGCATGPLSNARFWRLEQCTSAVSPTVRFNRQDGTQLALVPRAACQAVASSSEKIQRYSGQYVWQTLIADLEDVNAFATRDKDGRPVVVITMGMIKALGVDEDAWAGLLGHEIAHLVKRHGETREDAQAAARGVGEVLANLISYAVPGVGGAVGGSVAGTAVQWAIYGAYTRPQEAEADELGLQWMVAAGYDPRGLTRLFEVLGKSSSLPAFLSTHPAAKERADMVARFIASSPTHEKAGASIQTATAAIPVGAVPAQGCADATSKIRLTTLCLTAEGCQHQFNAIAQYCKGAQKPECVSARERLPNLCGRMSLNYNERNCEAAAAVVQANCHD